MAGGGGRKVNPAGAMRQIFRLGDGNEEAEIGQVVMHIVRIWRMVIAQYTNCGADCPEASFAIYKL